MCGEIFSFGSRRSVDTDKLCCSEIEREELVVVDGPDAVRACWLQLELCLYLPAESEVRREDAEDGRAAVVVGEDAGAGEQREPRNKVQLVARAVVDARAVPEAVEQIRNKLDDRTVEGWRKELFVKQCGLGDELFVEDAECFVSKTLRRFRFKWGFISKSLDFFEK